MKKSKRSVLALLPLLLSLTGCGAEAVLLAAEPVAQCICFSCLNGIDNFFGKREKQKEQTDRNRRNSAPINPNADLDRLAEMASSPIPSDRRTAIAGLAMRGDPRAREFMLITLQEERNADVLRTVFPVVFRSTQRADALPVCIEQLERVQVAQVADPALALELAEVLENFTGQHYGVNTNAWRSWWQANAAQLKYDEGLVRFVVTVPAPPRE